MDRDHEQAVNAELREQRSNQEADPLEKLQGNGQSQSPAPDDELSKLQTAKPGQNQDRAQEQAVNTELQQMQRPAQQDSLEKLQQGPQTQGPDPGEEERRRRHSQGPEL
jgi:hypothetical protein